MPESSTAAVSGCHEKGAGPVKKRCPGLATAACHEFARASKEHSLLGEKRREGRVVAVGHRLGKGLFSGVKVGGGLSPRAFAGNGDSGKTKDERHEAVTKVVEKTRAWVLHQR